MQLNYEQRMAIVKRWMKDDVLKRFAPPRGIDQTLAVKDVAEAVNRSIEARMTEDAMTERLSLVLAYVLREARGRTLPTVRDFQTACSSVRPKVNTTTAQPSTDFYGIVERRVRAGEPIADRWLREPGKSELLANTSLTEDDLNPYIAGLHHQEQEDF